MLPNNEILFNSVFIFKLLNIPFASCSSINLDFFYYHIQHILIIVLPLIMFETLGFIFSESFLHFRQNDRLL